uniref:Uncharacterized protein n=1 Tax=Amphimedon queenslandica TaxID=400682 RepID=A0A1X7TTV8_AMPQE
MTAVEVMLFATLLRTVHHVVWNQRQLKSSESEEELISNIDADLVDKEVRNVSEPELLEDFDPHDPLQSQIHSQSSEERSEYHFLI